MLTVACVRWGTKYSAQYVRILRDMVARNLYVPHRFVCFTDDTTDLDCETHDLPGYLEGWWNKLYLFKKGLFEDRVLFLDLDVVITNNLLPIVAIPSKFAIIEDWHLEGYNSSVFVMDADTHTEVWDEFTPRNAAGLPGDQDWISLKIRNAAVFPGNWCMSYRSHAVPGIPKGCKVVCFHGEPKPHEYPSPWVRELWKETNETKESMVKKNILSIPRPAMSG